MDRHPQRHARRRPRRRGMAQAVERQRRRLPGSQETPRRPGRPAPVRRPRQPRPDPGTQRDPRLRRTAPRPASPTTSSPDQHHQSAARDSHGHSRTRAVRECPRDTPVPRHARIPERRRHDTRTRRVAPPAARRPAAGPDGRWPASSSRPAAPPATSPCPAWTACATTSAGGNAGTAASPSATSSTTAGPSAYRPPSSAPHRGRRTLAPRRWAATLAPAVACPG